MLSTIAAENDKANHDVNNLLMTFKDLKKKVTLEVTQQQTRLFERLPNKPFWIWNIQEHKHEYVSTKGYCCFNHIVGLPRRYGQDKPLYDYEKIIFDSLVTHDGNGIGNGNANKHIWIKKATGLGISELMLRFMAWLCLKDNALSGSQMCIVTRPRIDLAIALIDISYIITSQITARGKLTSPKTTGFGYQQ